jgi:hypothetical protein
MNPHIRYFVSVVAIGVTVIWVIAWKFCPLDIWWMRILLGLWMTVPPLWFLLEWTLFKYQAKQEFDDFKHSQDLAGKLWAGVLAFLTLLNGVSVHIGG